MTISINACYFCVQYASDSQWMLMVCWRVIRQWDYDRLMLMQNLKLSTVMKQWWKVIVCLCVCSDWCHETLHASSFCSLVISPSLAYLLNPAKCDMSFQPDWVHLLPVGLHTLAFKCVESKLTTCCTFCRCLSQLPHMSVWWSPSNREVSSDWNLLDIKK